MTKLFFVPIDGWTQLSNLGDQEKFIEIDSFEKTVYFSVLRKTLGNQRKW